MSRFRILPLLLVVPLIASATADLFALDPRAPSRVSAPQVGPWYDPAGFVPQEGPACQPYAPAPRIERWYGPVEFEPTAGPDYSPLVPRMGPEYDPNSGTLHLGQDFLSPV